MSMVQFADAVARHARPAVRAIRRNPGFAATTILTLALAIGATTAMFTVIRAVLLQPLGYRDAGRLVDLAGGATPARFAELQAATRSFTAIGAYTREETVALAGRAEPEVLKAAHVSANFLEILAVRPRVGRGFRPDEDAAGARRVALISSELWQRRFGGDPQIAGKAVTIDAAECTIIGVLPVRFQFPFPGLDLWMTAPSEWARVPPKSRDLSPFLTLFGRLKPGVSLPQANAELKVLRRRYAMAHSAMLDAKPKTPEVTPMKDELVAGVQSMLWMLFGAVGFVLLIACANVASLLLARAASRSREFAVRSALGASRRRLIGQLLAESLVLSSLGGALGLLLAAWSLRAIPHLTAFDLPRAAEIHLSWAVLGFAAAISIGTGVLFGLAPSLGASRPDLMQVLRASGEGARQGVPGRMRPGVNLRSVLSVGQAALSIVLLIGVALLVESIAQLRRVNVGFNPAHLLTLSVSLPPLRYDTDLKKAAFFRELIQRADSIPGVRGAAAAMTLPMTGYAGTPVQDAAKPLLKLNERLIAKFFPVTPGYFRTLGIPLRRGRDFSDRDTSDAPRAAIIDESMARHFWPAYPAGLDPVGQRLLIGGIHSKPAEIVGIVPDVHQSLEGSVWPESVYVAFAQNPISSAMLAIRTAGDPLSLTGAVCAQVAAIDRDQPIASVRTMDELLEEEVGQRRLLAVLLGSFSAVALLLALIGIYGFIAYSVTQRAQEVGIRRALGAQQGDILRLVMGQGLALTLAGIVLGLAGAYALTRVMKALLFHVSLTDPATFVGIALLFLVVALTASYLPARRAARVDPMAALRVG